MTLSKTFLYTALLLTFSSCGQEKSKKEMHKHTNDLINETSPYLLQHAHNPVNWHAWNIENLAEAKELNKPILISIGYSSCHWCHVMEHESFEDEEVAAYMNEHFYCIKVDREERPDVDAIYMTAANIITGSGGWPLNCFALPDTRPFHAGTYYPKNGWLKLLQTVNHQYTNNISKLKQYATKLTQGIRMQETAISDNKSEILDKSVLNEAVEGWKASWDMKEGGMNRAPKFPMPSNLNYLQHYAEETNDSYARDFVKITLDKMAYGGIFDQIGGGFSRYSTDKIWKAPHFEKMLYDNAQLLTVYSQAYITSKDPLYLDVINKTIEWLEREMLDKSGMFYSALDADSEGEEGKYYVWTKNELQDVLKEDYKIVEAYYNIGKKALWEHGNNILLRDQSDEDVAKEIGISREKLRDRIDAINAQLLDIRLKRIAPGLDDKCLTSWNGLMVTGLSNAYKATGDEKTREMALNCMDALLKYQIEVNNVWHSYKAGKSTIDGMLEDYVFTSLGGISAYEISGNEKYLTASLSLTTEAIKRFYDLEKGLFYFNEDNELIIRTSEIYDNVIPSTNSAMAHLLQYVGLLNGNSKYLEMSDNLIGKIQSNITNYPGGHSNWSRAHLKSSAPFYEVVITGKDASAIAKKIHASYMPNAWILYAEKENQIPLFENRFVKNKTLIYVCKKGVCQLPSETIEDALKQMQQ
ncbi:MAG: thioredoxin domain-containing protein [Bacteroidia bacterium]|nr:thioredoxin domain-containing protein [Bacteroidia bacterium]NNJ55962.1 thioredoxin domain-containing protein [Bacteroidia bacterium]